MRKIKWLLIPLTLSVGLLVYALIANRERHDYTKLPVSLNGSPSPLDRIFWIDEVTFAVPGRDDLLVYNYKTNTLRKLKPEEGTMTGTTWLYDVKSKLFLRRILGKKPDAQLFKQEGEHLKVVGKIPSSYRALGFTTQGTLLLSQGKKRFIYDPKKEHDRIAETSPTAMVMGGLVRFHLDYKTAPATSGAAVHTSSHGPSSGTTFYATLEMILMEDYKEGILLETVPRPLSVFQKFMQKLGMKIDAQKVLRLTRVIPGADGMSVKRLQVVATIPVGPHQRTFQPFWLPGKKAVHVVGQNEHYVIPIGSDPTVSRL